MTLRPFQYREGTLCAGAVSLERIARRFGTPAYVYDFDAIAAAYRAYDRAFSGRGGMAHGVCAAVKANSNLKLLTVLARLGSGFDVVSGGELERVLHAGGDPGRVVFSGVGKTAPEIDAALRAGILLFNVESEPELALLARRASRLRLPARFGLRVNPDVAAGGHPHIATGLRRHKFGVPIADARRLYRRWAGRWLQPVGVSFHIGSQVLDVAPFAAATARVARLAEALERDGHPIRYFDAGGGLGIAYRPRDCPPTVTAYARALLAALTQAQRRRWHLLLEPGRSLTGAAGLLLTRVLYGKTNRGRRFAIMDAACNDLMRPALYGAYHEIIPVRRPPAGARNALVDIVGPVCESGDTFARNRRLPLLQTGDLLAILDAGAYGFTLSSNYNTRLRPPEVAVRAGRVALLRRRECLDDLPAPEM